MIQLVLFDLDGTLTDGGYYVTDDGKISRRFFSRDYEGLSHLEQSGTMAAIITRADGDTFDATYFLGFDNMEVFVDVQDKKAIIDQSYIQAGKCQWEEVAFIGDDVNDAELLNAVGLAACPKDAHSFIKALVEQHADGWVMENNGGKGCVRELIDLILGLQKHNRSLQNVENK